MVANGLGKTCGPGIPWSTASLKPMSGKDCTGYAFSPSICCWPLLEGGYCAMRVHAWPVQNWCPQIDSLLRVTSCFKSPTLIWVSNLIFKCSLLHGCNTKFSGCVNDDYIQLDQNSDRVAKGNTHGEWRKRGKDQYFSARKHQYYRKRSDLSDLLIRNTITRRSFCSLLWTKKYAAG